MTDKRLAEMTPEELTKLFLETSPTPYGDALHALIQRATREAREGMVSYELLTEEREVGIKNVAFFRTQRDEARTQLREATEKLEVQGKSNAAKQARNELLALQLREAQSLADRLQAERDTLAWDKGVAERRAKHEGAREALTRLAEIFESIGSNVPLSHAVNLRDKQYPAPVEAAPQAAVPSVGEKRTVTLNGATVEYRADNKYPWLATKNEKRTVACQEELHGLLAAMYYTPTADEYAALLALATGGGR
jgi:hypothetical protein